MSDIEEETKGRKDEKMEHSAVGESSSEQQIRKSANYTCSMRKNWSPSYSGTRSYGRQAGRPLGRRKCCKGRKFKFCILTFKMRIRHLE